MPETRHRITAIAGGRVVADGDGRAFRLPPALARTAAEAAGLLRLLDRVVDDALDRARAGEPDIRFGLRREYDADGHRTWNVREDRDLYRPYAVLPRRPLSLWPSAAASALVGLVASVHGHARRRAMAGMPLDRFANVLAIAGDPWTPEPPARSHGCPAPRAVVV